MGEARAERAQSVESVTLERGCPGGAEECKQGANAVRLGPTASLQWMGKEAMVAHHREVAYHLPRGEASLSVGAARLKREGVTFRQIPCQIKVS